MIPGVTRELVSSTPFLPHSANSSPLTYFTISTHTISRNGVRLEESVVQNGIGNNEGHVLALV